MRQMVELAYVKWTAEADRCIRELGRDGISEDQQQAFAWQHQIATRQISRCWEILERRYGVVGA